MSTAPILLTLLSLTASAQSVDFSGSWLLDEAASGSMDPILMLQDVSWFKRQLAGGLDAEVEIVQTDQQLTVTFENVLGAVQVLRPGGPAHETVNPAGMPTTFTTRWHEGGAVLVASGPCDAGDGQVGTLTERRSLSADGQTMTIQVSVSAPDGRSATVDRVFRRQ